MKRLFTERHGQGRPRIAEALDEGTRAGLLAYVASLMSQHWFGASFPEQCPDGTANCGCDLMCLWKLMEGYDVVRPDVHYEFPPSDGQLYDLLEFSYEKVALPQKGGWHDSHRHHHFDYNQPAGRAQFQEEVNRIFERNGIAMELRDGEVTRLAAATFHETLSTAAFKTGDNEPGRHA